MDPLKPSQGSKLENASPYRRGDLQPCEFACRRVRSARSSAKRETKHVNYELQFVVERVESPGLARGPGTLEGSMNNEIIYTYAGTRKRIPCEPLAVAYSDPEELKREAKIARIAKCFQYGVRIGMRVEQRP